MLVRPLAPKKLPQSRRLVHLLVAPSSRPTVNVHLHTSRIGCYSRLNRLPLVVSFARRQIHLEPFVLPPVVFTGLLIALWTWKSFMMVLFQNKIIYMPGLPPTARGEKLSDYTNLVSGIEWQEARTRAADGTDLALAVASVSSPTSAAASEYSLSEPSVAGHVYILYLQGNANSIPPRLPDISWVLGKLRDSNDAVGVKMRYTMVCLSYRGYWTSRGRPSEVGINQDTVAAVQWIAQLHENTYSQAIIRPKPIFVLWGQSVGAGFATNLAASGTIPHTLPLEAMILETPFLSIRTMLETLYPQKWLPYRYLHPFLRNHLDSWKNLGVIASSSDERGEMLPHVFILQAARDELVPAHHASDLEKRCSELGLPVERKKAPRAFHNEALYRAKAPVVNFITRQASRVMSGVENFPHT